MAASRPIPSGGPEIVRTAMLVAAMVPIALGQGPGAGARASMAKVIIGAPSATQNLEK